MISMSRLHKCFSIHGRLTKEYIDLVTGIKSPSSPFNRKKVVDLVILETQEGTTEFEDP